jgi:hypothetical protein
MILNHFSEDHNNSFLAYDRFQLAKSNAFEYIAGIITTNSTEFDAEYKTWEANFEQAREQVTIELKAERERKRQQRIQAEQKELEEQKRQNEVQQQRLLAEQSRAEKRPIQIERRPQSDRPRQPMRDEQTQRNPPRNTEIEFSRAEMRQVIVL